MHTHTHTHIDAHTRAWRPSWMKLHTHRDAHTHTARSHRHTHTHTHTHCRLPQTHATHHQPCYYALGCVSQLQRPHQSIIQNSSRTTSARTRETENNNS